MKLSVMKTLTLMAWLSFPTDVFAISHAMLEQANQCRAIEARLERLACFDQLFATPIEVTDERITPFYSPQWNHAMEARDKVNEQQGWLLTYEPEEKGNAWLAMLAQNSDVPSNQLPVLLLSCINNISRVELALPAEVQHARIRVSMRETTQYWRSDDNGVIFSSGRGLPAIEMMKSMSKESYLTLRSNAEFADGLRFDTRQLNQGLAVLRERCGW